MPLMMMVMMLMVLLMVLLIMMLMAKGLFWPSSFDDDDDDDADNNNFYLWAAKFFSFQLFDGDVVSIDTEDDTIDDGLTCCFFHCWVSQSSCIQLINDAIDNDGNDDDGNDTDDTTNGTADTIYVYTNSIVKFLV